MQKKIILFFVILSSLLIRNIYAHQIDSVATLYKNNTSIKLQSNNILSEIGISSHKDKIVIVRKYYKYFEYISPKRNYMEVQYELWLINLMNSRAKLIAEFSNKDIGIEHPTWSPDNKWIAFETYSLAGHSPLTTRKTWIVDSNGKKLQELILPSPYDKFSNSIEGWIGDHALLVSGLVGKFKNNKYITIEAKFNFDCEKNTMNRIK